MQRLYGPFLEGLPAVGLLIVRLLAGSALMVHGWPKIQNPFDWMPGAPFPSFLLALAALSEFGGGLALILGVLTPVAAFGVLCTMAVAVSIHFKGGDPWINPPGEQGATYELALVYLGIALLLMLAGPGRYSLDAFLWRRALTNSGDGVARHS